MGNSKLATGDFGEEVAQVHDALARHGIEVSPEERKRKFFGPTTRAAVGQFQAVNDIDLTCEVCLATASSLMSGKPEADAESAAGKAAATTAASVNPSALAALRAPKLKPDKQISPSGSAAGAEPTTVPAGGNSLIKRIESPPPPDLGPTSDPVAIANLQDALLFLIEKERMRLPDDARRELEERLRNDRARQTYGSGTGNLVILVREQFGLEPGEVVDEATAAMLNRLLQELGAFDARPTEWVVRGQITDAGGPVNDITVSVYDRDLFFRRNGPLTGQLLGTDITNNRDDGRAGWFELPYAIAAFSDGDIPADGTFIPDLIFALSRDGQALERFQIFRLPDGKELDEEVPVSDDDLIMGLQARRAEEVRIVVEGGAPKPPLSEYEQLVLALVPLLPEQVPDNADAARREALVGEMLLRFDEEKHRDISFAARETRLERFLIEKLAAAFKLARDPFENSVSASVFYGFARAGIGSSVIELARASAEDLRLALKKASTGVPSIITPFLPDSRLDESVQTVRDLLLRILPKYRAGKSTPSLADLLGADLPDAAEQATLWRSFSDHVGTSQEFWEKLGTLPGFGDPEKIARVKLKFQLGALTRNSIGLIDVIRSKHPEVTSIEELAFELDTQEKWQALLDRGEVSIPDDVPGKPEERKANYAASLATAVQIAHPSAALANLVADLPATELSNAQPAVAKFLADAVYKAQFDFVEGRINELLATHGNDLLNDIQVEEQPVVIAQVKRLQRLFRLSTSPKSVKALVEAGFSSARQIAELPPEVAIDMLTPMVGDAEARLVINRASNISAAAIHQYVLLNEAINSGIPGAAL